MKDVEDFKNNSISAPVDKDNSSISSNSNDTHGTGLESKDDVNNEEDELDDEELF